MVGYTIKNAGKRGARHQLREPAAGYGKVGVEVDKCFPVFRRGEKRSSVGAADEHGSPAAERRLGKKYSRSAQEGKDGAFVYTSVGDGTTAEGEVEEAIRDAVRFMAPVLFVVEDDGWAISTPADVNIPGGKWASINAYTFSTPESRAAQTPTGLAIGEFALNAAEHGGFLVVCG